MTNDSHADAPIGPGNIAVVCGGVGAARFLRGLLDATDDPAVGTNHGIATNHAMITAVVNTGDDCVLHGLSISPDLDTITYTLAGAIDPERGWGLVDETWRAMAALERFDSVRPEGSAAAPRWFNLGDRDLATHFYRTARLDEGATLTEVTNEIRRAWGIPIRLLPMTNDRLSTMVTIIEADADTDTDTDTDTGAGSGGQLREVSFQDYFVRHRHGVAVASVRFDGEATLAPPARAALMEADTIVIAPSNPLVSIGPIRSLAGVDELLTARRDQVVAVSPIVGGVALKGPADRMLVELGHEASVVGVAELYAPIASTLVIDTVDAALAGAVEATGMRCVVTDTVMSTPSVARALAVTVTSCV